MARSISIVEYKVQQAAFFLQMLREAGLDFFAAQCFTDAFASAARSITLAMQAVMNDVPEFQAWYARRRAQLRSDALARFFNEYRNASVHIGDSVIRAGSNRRGPDGSQIVHYYFMPIPDVTEVPTEDVVTVCSRHFATLLQVVFDAFYTFKYHVDDRWYLTKENFRKMGKTMEDALMELGFPEGWLDCGQGIPESKKWRLLRKTQAVGCQINDLFMSYLGRSIEGPDTAPADEERGKP